MKIKPVLARLHDAIGSQATVEQMVLLPGPAAPPTNGEKSHQVINLVVGYNSSPRSQTALDIGLLIAHQTSLATQKQVRVHVVYVLDNNQSTQHSNGYNSASVISSPIGYSQIEVKAACAVQSAVPVLTPPKTQARATNPYLSSTSLLEQADHILWQARCLAEEWRGTFVAHLRFGCLSDELQEVVESEAADLLLLGCCSKEHPVVQKLGANFPCAVLGIPQ